MANQRGNRNQQRKGDYTEGSGTQYHKEHAGNVPGYGNNPAEQNQKS
jgi:hypothetical protein